MTFVKTRLLIEKMTVGDVATILLRGAEPIENVPASVAELGHAILEMAPARPDAAPPTGCADIQAGDMRLRIRKE
jgi:TusA-related sulfurtransferase